ncbi:MAG: hypothetical protein SWX82_14130 [Cyanobacteriota bacterium]|nr:hypothetical protein [Cyanobacteriota bacterium]
MKAKYGDLRLKATWEKAYFEYIYQRFPIIVAIAEVEKVKPQPQPKPQPKPKLPATVNVASVLAKLEKSSSTLDLVGDGNISPVAKNVKRVFQEELVINLGVINC